MPGPEARPGLIGDDHFLLGNHRASGAYRPPRKGLDTNLTGMLCLALVPWAMFAMVLVSFIYLYHHYHLVVCGIVFGCFAVAGSLMVINARRSQGGSWYLYLGGLCALATICGASAGIYVYHTHMFLFFSYQERRSYTDVLPMEAAAAHSDAGKIVFGADARVDPTRSVGYKAGSYYCVAPIFDDESSQGSRVEYWAAGVDCCSQRGDFSCDSAWDRTARSGLVMIPTSHPWLFPSPLENYKKAVKEAEGAYRFVSAKNPILVRWVANPLTVQMSYKQESIGFAVVAVFLYFLASVILGTVLQKFSKRWKK